MSEIKMQCDPIVFDPPPNLQPTPKMLEHYDEHGYVIVSGLLKTDELERYNQRFNDLAEGRVEPSPHMTIMKDVMVAKGVVNAANQQMTINKIQSFIYDDVLVEYSKNEQIVDLVENLMAPNAGVRIIHSMLINKPPGLVDETGAVVGGRHPIHQDLFYFDLRPPEMIVATWTAMQDVNRDNGCLVVLPGSHKSLYNTSMGGLLAHEKPTWKYLNTACMCLWTMACATCPQTGETNACTCL